MVQACLAPGVLPKQRLYGLVRILFLGRVGPTRKAERLMQENKKSVEVDAVEEVARRAHIVLPVVGAVLMSLLAFIAIYMA